LGDQIPSAPTMALVTDQFSCERIIKAARAVADQSGTPLVVINVGSQRAGYNPEAIDFLYRVSAENGAVMSIFYSDTPEAQLVSVIRSQQPCRIVTGMPQAGASPLHKLWIRFSEISFFTVDMSGDIHPVTRTDAIKMEVGV